MQLVSLYDGTDMNQCSSSSSRSWMTTLISLATTSRGTPGLLISNFLSCQHARIRFHTLIDPKKACQKKFNFSGSQWIHLVQIEHYVFLWEHLQSLMTMESLYCTQIQRAVFSKTTRHHKLPRYVTDVREDSQRGYLMHIVSCSTPAPTPPSTRQGPCLLGHSGSHTELVDCLE
jgi:hypothetical protein